MTPNQPTEVDIDPHGEDPSLWRRIGFGVLGLVAAVVLLVLTILLALQSSTVSTGLVRALAPRLSPEGTTLSVGRVDGSWLGSLTLEDVALVRGGGDTALAAERVFVDHRLGPLLRRRLVLDSLSLVRPRIRMVQSDSAWTLVPSSPAPSPADTATGAGWPVRIDALRVTDGALTLRAAPDTVYRIEGLDVAASDVSIGNGDPTGKVASASARLLWPNPADTAEALSGALRIRDAEWSGRRIALDTLALQAGSTRIGGSGTVVLDADSTLPTAFRLRADPLVFADLRPVFPAAGPGAATVQIGVNGVPGGALGLDASLELAEGGGTLTAEGRWGPSGRDNPQRVEGHVVVAGLDPQRIVADTALPSRLDGTLEVRFTGRDRSRLDGQATAVFDVGGLPAVGDTHVELAARVTAGQGTVELDVRSDDLRLAGDGSVDLRPERPDYRWDGRVRFAPPELARVAGRMSVVGQGVPPSGRVELDARLDTVVASGTRLDEARVQITIEEETLRGDVRLGAEPGRVTLSLAGEPFADTLRLRIQDGRAQDLDLAALREGLVATGLNARFEGTLTVPPGAPPRADATVSLDSSSVGRETVRSGDLRLRWQEQGTTLAGEVALAAGRVAVDARARLDREPLRFSVRELRFEDLDVGALTDSPTLTTALTGTMALEGVGSDPASLDAEGSLTLEDSRINEARIQSGAVQFRAEEGRVRADLELDLEAGAVRAEGALDPGDVPSWSARASVDLPRLGALLGDTIASSLIAEIDAEGRGLERETAQGTLRLDLEEATWAAVRADSGTVRAELAAGLLRVDTLTLRSNVVRLDGGGRVPLTPAAGTDTADFQAHVALESLTPVEESLGLEALTAGDGSLDVRVQGDVDSLRVTGVAHVGALAFGSTRLVGLDLESMARWSPDRGWRSAGGELVLDRLSLPTTGVTETRLTADWSAGEDLVVGARARIDQRRTAELEARLDPAAEQPALTVEQASFQVDESRWTLPQPAQIRYGNGIAVEGLELATDGGAQRIALDLSLGGEAPLRVRADVEALRVETIADLAGFDRLQGELDLRMDLEGSGEAARGDADITFDVESEEGGGGTLRATATFQDGRVLVDGEIEQQDRTALQLAGSVPVPGADAGTLDLQIQADSFGVDFATPFLDPATVRSLDGAVDGRVDIQGTLDDPSLDGALTASDVYAHIVPLGLRYGLEGRVRLGGSAVQVPDLRITSGEGAMVLSGVIDVERGSIGRYDLDVRMDDFRAIRTDLVHAEVSGDLAIQGTVPEPVIGGSVTIERGDLYLGGAVASGDVEDVVLTDEDYAALEEYFGFPIQRLEESEAPGFEAVALDLSVQVGRDSWLRQSANPELAVQVAGEMTIRKDPGPDLELLGELEAIPQRSYVEQFGRRFDLRQGQLVFRGDPLATRLDLQAVYEVPSRTDDEPEATIVLGMEGEVGDLRIVLSAEPTMDNADIVSYIATGRPASSSLDLGGGNGGGESVLERGGGLALDRVGGLIESFAADRVGLDVVEIRREGLEAATLVAGRYVSPSLYLGFQQPVSLDASSDQGGNAETQVEIEYQAFRWLLLNLQSGGDALQFFLRTRYGY